MNQSKKVLVAAPIHPILSDALSSNGYQLLINEKITQSMAYGLLADCIGVITSTRLQLNRDLIDAAPHLRWIGRMGSGLEVIDIDYAASRGIATFASPEGNCNAVGEHALGMLLCLVRRIGWSQAELIKGIWKRDENRGYELEGKTVGIIGLGHTGSSFARKLTGFDVRILGFDKSLKPNLPPGIEQCNSINQLMEEADIISFHIPLDQTTRHYFNHDFLMKMKKPFMLINTSRGAVVDTEALVSGLRSEKIIGACLDVFEEEPFTGAPSGQLASLKDWLAHPSVVATPHIAGYSYQALYKMSRVLAEKIQGAGF